MVLGFMHPVLTTKRKRNVMVRDGGVVEGNSVKGEESEGQGEIV